MGRAARPPHDDWRKGHHLQTTPPPPPSTVTRAVLKEKQGWGVVTPTGTNVRGRSLLHGQDMGKTQDHRNHIERWLAVGGWWRLAVGGWRSMGAVLNKKKWGFLGTPLTTASSSTAVSQCRKAVG